MVDDRDFHFFGDRVVEWHQETRRRSVGKATQDRETGKQWSRLGEEIDGVEGCDRQVFGVFKVGDPSLVHLGSVHGD